MALEVVKVLCSENRRGRVVLIDGSIEFAKSLKSVYFGNLSELSDIQTKVVMDVIGSFQPSMVTAKVSLKLNVNFIYST